MNFKLTDKLIKRIEQINKECLGCNLCVRECIFLREYIKNPKIFFKKVLLDGQIDNRIPYYCFGCNVCNNVCPKGIDLNNLFMEVKKDISKANKKSPHLKHFIIHNHQHLVNSKLFSLVKGENKIAFMPGCSLSSYKPELVKKVYDLLNQEFNGISIILKCCGNPSLSLGEEEKFNKIYNDLVLTIKKKNIDHIITACQSCYKTIKLNSPNLKVTSLWEVLSKMDLPKINIDEKFFIWDSCSAENEIKESIRNLAEKIGLNIENNSIPNKAKCCGLGGCVHTVNKDLFNKNLSENVAKIKASSVLTYCAGCRDALSNSKDAYHILDIIFKMDLNAKKPNGTIKSWTNRLKFKRMIGNIDEKE